MKFNISVEVDWMGEDGNLDDVIKKQLVEGVVERISQSAINSVKDNVLGKIESQINAMVQKTYDDFLDKGVTITDQWGDVKQKDVRIYDLIKGKCDKWLITKVDSEGKESSYNANYTRMEWLVNNQLNKQTKSMADEIVKKVSEEIKKYINDAVKNSIGEKLVKEIGIESIISKAK